MIRGGAFRGREAPRHLHAHEIGIQSYIIKRGDSPVQARRIQLVARLEEQKALFADPAFARTVKRWKLVDGQRVQVDQRLQIRPWWGTDEKGLTVLQLKYGLRPLEFEKGKSGIVVGHATSCPRSSTR